jgi:predicted 2-oxoglutarate/Fe(II)-dependent dioxygenase YbiX
MPGELAPWFHAQVLGGLPRYAFHTVAGRWVIMLMIGSAAHPAPDAALQLVMRNRALFDDQRVCFFGVTIDPSDAEQGRIAQQLPGIRWILDYDRQVSTLYGAIKQEGDAVAYAPHWLLLDPMLRVRSRVALAEGAALFAELAGYLDRPVEIPTAPVLIVPDVLSRELCHTLIELARRDGVSESGFMTEENGQTVMRIDHAHKRRSDYTVTDDALLTALKERLARALRPMVRRAFQFDATRVERFIVGCYEAEQGGHFRAHRDNTTKGTAHRKFACTINLNADDYDGGDLCFPEFGQRTYRAPTGGAVVFSCSLLHEARPVTRGQRYAFLPFLYDDDGARIRERNLQFVAGEHRGYRSGLPSQ